jgi:hypothetical protein
MSVALVAGVAALVSEFRPNLEAWEVRESLVGGAGPGRALDAPGALDAAALRAAGGCRTSGEPREQLQAERRPWWRRIRVRTEYEAVDNSSGGPRPDEPSRGP